MITINEFTNMCFPIYGELNESLNLEFYIISKKVCLAVYLSRNNVAFS